MKILYLIILFIPILLLGCSSAYRVTDFPTEEKFYEDFNSFAKDKSVKVTLINDSSFTPENNVQILKDSLFILTTREIIEKQTLRNDEIQGVEYYSDNIPDKILLKNGKSIVIKRMVIMPDSSVDVLKVEYTHKLKPLALNQVKEISYKNHWLGIPFGFVGGELFGIITGWRISRYESQHENFAAQNNQLEELAVLFYGIVLGPIVGSIVGWIVGWDYVYVFNP
jgi:hypothetical protein